MEIALINVDSFIVLDEDKDGVELDCLIRTDTDNGMVIFSSHMDIEESIVVLNLPIEVLETAVDLYQKEVKGKLSDGYK